MLRSICLSFLAVLCIMICKAGDLTLDKQNCEPGENMKYASLSKIHLKFDFSEIDTQGYSVEDMGVETSLGRKKTITLYKGDPEDGNKIFTFYTVIITSDVGFLTGGDVILDLGQEYTLEPDQKYTLQIPASGFYLSSKDDVLDRIATNDEEYIVFYGGTNSADDFVMTNIFPNPQISAVGINKLAITFNRGIIINTDLNAKLFESDDCLKEGILALSEDAENTVVVSFDETKLYVSHNYTVKIPEGAILSEATGEPYKEIVLNYSGASYDYFGYGRCNPGNNATVSYLGAVHVPLTCDAQYNIARAHAKAYFYKDGVEDPLKTIDCQIGVDSRSWDIPVWDFELEPGAKYRIEMPADQYTLWYYNDNGGITQVKESSNEALVLNYTVAENPVMPTPVTLGNAAPAEGESLETLENLQIFFNTFTYDAATYYPEFANSSLEAGYNTIYLYEGEKEEPVKAINVDMKWNNSNQYWIEPNAPLNYKMYEGVDYKIVVPAGMFISSHNNLGKVVANPEFVLNLKGASSLAGLELSALSIAEGGKHSHVGVVSSTVKTTVTPAENAKFVLKNGDDIVAEAAVKAHNDNGEAFVYGDFTGVETEKGKEYTVTLPMGSLIGADGIVTNPEVSANFSGLDVDKEPEVVYVQPEHVNVYLEVGDHVAVAHKVAKEQDATVNVAPTENWILSKLTLNDADVTEDVAADGNYTIPAASLKEDANLKAEFAYNGTPMFDFTTSVDGIVDGCDYKVYSDNNDLVIENVPANAKVAVYSVAGLKIAEESNLGDTDIIRISLNPGVYVVIINNDALKVKH